MTDSQQNLAEQLQQRFEGMIDRCIVATGQVTVELPAANLIKVCKVLRDEEEFAFEQLTDVCGVDYYTYGQADWETEDTTSTGFSRGVARGIFHVSDSKDTARLAAVYHLLSLKHNRRLRLRCHLDNDPPIISSVVDIWASANWFEREAFDLYGILFEGHPDLRRILTDYGFVGHPFRKDFPLEGNVEVRYDPDKQRVVYQPVTITNRVLVPKVIRKKRFTEAIQEEVPAENREA
ncbi:MAG TPA: NADH-quinone oxidoreductase subunit C [Gammaproteobacteria bacterium]|nr:NADH-quinone oxidoreductase subunit C [Gammaproteobacteria bacterium]